MSYYQTSHWVERDDQSPGYIYLMEAVGYHGIIPGRLLRRCKIGLSRNPEARLETFHANQPPCNVKIIRAIFVEDMASVEADLHRSFKSCNIKLHKSREWFDLSPWQYARVHWEFTQHETHVWSFADIPKRALVGGLIALVGVGVMVGSVARQDASQPQPTSANIRK